MDFSSFSQAPGMCGQILYSLLCSFIYYRNLCDDRSHFIYQFQRIYSTHSGSWPTVGSCMAVSIKFGLSNVFCAKLSFLLRLLRFSIRDSSAACNFDDHHSEQENPFDWATDCSTPSPESSHGHHIKFTQHYSAAQ